MKPCRLAYSNSIHEGRSAESRVDRGPGIGLNAIGTRRRSVFVPNVDRHHSSRARTATPVENAVVSKDAKNSIRPCPPDLGVQRPGDLACFFVCASARKRRGDMGLAVGEGWEVHDG